MNSGRICPIDYKIDSKLFKNINNINYETIYIAGGIYGNYFALKSLVEMAKKDNAFIILNGDYHWFDYDYYSFLCIEDIIKDYMVLNGNVEKELLRNESTGCGCAYPNYVDDDVVKRSNHIHSCLKHNIQDNKIIAKISSRKEVCTIRLKDYLIGISHGDEKSVAGWSCSNISLRNNERQKEIINFMDSLQLNVFATSHTCEPIMMYDENHIVINNGAAGMPNFNKSGEGVVTRISFSESIDRIYGSKVGELYIDAVAIKYDNEAFIKWFETHWKKGTPAHISYFDRILNGTGKSYKESILKL